MGKTTEFNFYTDENHPVNPPISYSLKKVAEREKAFREEFSSPYDDDSVTYLLDNHDFNKSLLLGAKDAGIAVYRTLQSFAQLVVDVWPAQNTGCLDEGQMSAITLAGLFEGEESAERFKERFEKSNLAIATANKASRERNIQRIQSIRETSESVLSFTKDLNQLMHSFQERFEHDDEDALSQPEYDAAMEKMQGRKQAMIKLKNQLIESYHQDPVRFLSSFASECAFNLFLTTKLPGLLKSKSRAKREQVIFLNQGTSPLNFTGTERLSANRVRQVKGQALSLGLGKATKITGGILKTSPKLTPQLRQEIKHAITRDFNATKLAGRTIYHGTVEGQVKSILNGPKNVGRGFGGPGLYVTLDNEFHIAHEYANIALTRAAQGEKSIVMTGKINPNRNYDVARIKIANRNETPDIKQGLFPADWAKNDGLKDFITKNYDILEVSGAKSAGYAIGTDKYLVINERAGKEAIKWLGHKIVDQPKPGMNTTGAEFLSIKYPGQADKFTLEHSKAVVKPATEGGGIYHHGLNLFLEQEKPGFSKARLDIFQATTRKIDPKTGEFYAPVYKVISDHHDVRTALGMTAIVEANKETDEQPNDRNVEEKSLKGLAITPNNAPQPSQAIESHSLATQSKKADNLIYFMANLLSQQNEQDFSMEHGPFDSESQVIEKLDAHHQQEQDESLQTKNAEVTEEKAPHADNKEATNQPSDVIEKKKLLQAFEITAQIVDGISNIISTQKMFHQKAKQLAAKGQDMIEQGKAALAESLELRVEAHLNQHSLCDSPEARLLVTDLLLTEMKQLISRVHQAKELDDRLRQVLRSTLSRMEDTVKKIKKSSFVDVEGYMQVATTMAVAKGFGQVGSEIASIGFNMASKIGLFGWFRQQKLKRLKRRKEDLELGAKTFEEGLNVLRHNAQMKAQDLSQYQADLYFTLNSLAVSADDKKESLAQYASTLQTSKDRLGCSIKDNEQAKAQLKEQLIAYAKKHISSFQHECTDSPYRGQHIKTLTLDEDGFPILIDEVNHDKHQKNYDLIQFKIEDLDLKSEELEKELMAIDEEIDGIGFKIKFINTYQDAYDAHIKCVYDNTDLLPIITQLKEVNQNIGQNQELLENATGEKRVTLENKIQTLEADRELLLQEKQTIIDEEREKAAALEFYYTGAREAEQLIQRRHFGAQQSLHLLANAGHSLKELLGSLEQVDKLSPYLKKITGVAHQAMNLSLPAFHIMDQIFEINKNIQRVAYQGQVNQTNLSRLKDTISGLIGLIYEKGFISWQQFSDYLAQLKFDETGNMPFEEYVKFYLIPLIGIMTGSMKVITIAITQYLTASKRNGQQELKWLDEQMKSQFTEVKKQLTNITNGLDQFQTNMSKRFLHQNHKLAAVRRSLNRIERSQLHQMTKQDEVLSKMNIKEHQDIKDRVAPLLLSIRHSVNDVVSNLYSKVPFTPEPQQINPMIGALSDRLIESANSMYNHTGIYQSNAYTYLSPLDYILQFYAKLQNVGDLTKAFSTDLPNLRVLVEEIIILHDVFSWLQTNQYPGYQLRTINVSLLVGLLDYMDKAVLQYNRLLKNLSDLITPEHHAKLLQFMKTYALSQMQIFKTVRSQFKKQSTINVEKDEKLEQSNIVAQDSIRQHQRMTTVFQTLKVGSSKFSVSNSLHEPLSKKLSPLPFSPAVKATFKGSLEAGAPALILGACLAPVSIPLAMAGAGFMTGFGAFMGSRSHREQYEYNLSLVDDLEKNHHYFAKLLHGMPQASGVYWSLQDGCFHQTSNLEKITFLTASSYNTNQSGLDVRYKILGQSVSTYSIMTIPRQFPNSLEKQVEDYDESLGRLFNDYQQANKVANNCPNQDGFLENIKIGASILKKAHRIPGRQKELAELFFPADSIRVLIEHFNVLSQNELYKSGMVKIQYDFYHRDKDYSFDIVFSNEQTDVVLMRFPLASFTSETVHSYCKVIIEDNGYQFKPVLGHIEFLLLMMYQSEYPLQGLPTNKSTRFVNIPDYSMTQERSFIGFYAIMEKLYQHRLLVTVDESEVLSQSRHPNELGLFFNADTDDCHLYQGHHKIEMPNELDEYLQKNKPESQTLFQYAKKNSEFILNYIKAHQVILPSLTRFDFDQRKNDILSSWHLEQFIKGDDFSLISTFIGNYENNLLVFNEIKPIIDFSEFFKLQELYQKEIRDVMHDLYQVEFARKNDNFDKLSHAYEMVRTLLSLKFGDQQTQVILDDLNMRPPESFKESILNHPDLDFIGYQAHMIRVERFTHGNTLNKMFAQLQEEQPAPVIDSYNKHRFLSNRSCSLSRAKKCLSHHRLFSENIRNWADSINHDKLHEQAQFKT